MTRSGPPVDMVFGAVAARAIDAVGTSTYVRRAGRRPRCAPRPIDVVRARSPHRRRRAHRAHSNPRRPPRPHPHAGPRGQGGHRPDRRRRRSTCIAMRTLPTSLPPSCSASTWWWPLRTVHRLSAGARLRPGPWPRAGRRRPAVRLRRLRPSTTAAASAASSLVLLANTSSTLHQPVRRPPGMRAAAAGHRAPPAAWSSPTSGRGSPMSGRMNGKALAGPEGGVGSRGGAAGRPSAIRTMVFPLPASSSVLALRPGPSWGASGGRCMTSWRAPEGGPQRPGLRGRPSLPNVSRPCKLRGPGRLRAPVSFYPRASQPSSLATPGRTLHRPARRSWWRDDHRLLTGDLVAGADAGSPCRGEPPGRRPPRSPPRRRVRAGSKTGPAADMPVTPN